MAKTMKGKIKKEMTRDGRKNVSKYLDEESGFKEIREGKIFEEKSENSWCNQRHWGSQD